MFLIAATSRLRSDTAERRGSSPWNRPSRLARFLRNLFDLSVRPATALDFAARCILLVLFAVVCHCIGAGSASFVKAAPLSALALIGALFVFALAKGSGRG
jgi:hypothetical protein